MMKLPSLQDLKVRGKAVIARVDFNVPYDSENVSQDFRIKKTIPTLEYLLERGARIILISHLEKDGKTPSLAALAKLISKYFLPKLKFVPDITGSRAKQSVNTLQPGEAILLENLRQTPAEIENKENFAKSLASLGDIYINEAFSASHRNHASIVGIPKFLPSYPGLLFQEEIDRLAKAFDPPKPFLFILGGKKISTKAKMIEKFLKKADCVFIGGAMANLFLKSRGYSIGASYVEEGTLSAVKSFISSKKILLPSDLIIQRGRNKKNISLAGVKDKDIIYDSGPETLKTLGRKIQQSKFILWNGPLGYIEGNFKTGTQTLAKILAKAKGEVIVGGGDTVAFLESQKLIASYSFVSTGGGAMLEFLAEETLPGIEALLKSR